MKRRDLLSVATGERVGVLQGDEKERRSVRVEAVVQAEEATRTGTYNVLPPLPVEMLLRLVPVKRSREARQRRVLARAAPGRRSAEPSRELPLGRRRRREGVEGVYITT
jgi:hypothetical protein